MTVGERAKIDANIKQRRQKEQLKKRLQKIISKRFH